MTPIVGMLLYLVCLSIVCVVVRKRGRPMWPYLLLVPIASLVLVPVTARAGGTSTAAGFIAFLPVVAGLFIAIASRTGSQIAADQGSYRGMRKCPMCAESIRAEARKCKHCGSEVALP